MLIPRHLPQHIQKLASFFPAISLTGPRQSGKTTLLKELYSDYKYVSLENPDVRAFAKANPQDFFREYNDKVIFDEAQRFPDLFSYLQGMIDDDRRPGRFILSGSQNFLMRKNITQSLAGRIGIAKLLPLDHKEQSSANLLPDTKEEAILQGGYPGLIDKDFDKELFFSAYVASYVERDVAELISAANVSQFRQFIQICATYASQTINLAKISNDAGVSVPTVKAWLGILEQSYIIFRLPPFFRNMGKRITKSHKLYFYDTGLLCHLLRLNTELKVRQFPKLGALFENMIIAEAYKSFHHRGREPYFFFYRDNNKNEVDLLTEDGNSVQLWEIKAGENFRPTMIKSLERVANYWDRPASTALIYAGDEEHRFNKSTLINWRNAEWKR